MHQDPRNDCALAIIFGLIVFQKGSSKTVSTVESPGKTHCSRRSTWALIMPVVNFLIAAYREQSLEGYFGGFPKWSPLFIKPTDARHFRESPGKFSTVSSNCILSPFILLQDQMKNEFMHGFDMRYAYSHLLFASAGVTNMPRSGIFGCYLWHTTL